MRMRLRFSNCRLLIIDFTHSRAAPGVGRDWGSVYGLVWLPRDPHSSSIGPSQISITTLVARLRHEYHIVKKTQCDPMEIRLSVR